MLKDSIQQGSIHGRQHSTPKQRFDPPDLWGLRVDSLAERPALDDPLTLADRD